MTQDPRLPRTTSSIGLHIWIPFYPWFMFCRVAGKTSRQLLRLFMEATHPRLQSDQNPITRSQSACCRKWTPKCLVTSLGLFLLVWCLRSLATFEQAIQVLDQVAKSTVRLLLKWSATLQNFTIGTYPNPTPRLHTSSHLSPRTSLKSANCHNYDIHLLSQRPALW